jgi:protein tyrosine phosphatase (PTP) superfamily phosphohydrolase (DUF442 family)
MVPGVTYLGNGMGTYGQPAPDAFARFAKAGYKSVLNLRFKHEDGFLKDEQQMSAKAGLTYANSPFGPNAPVDVQVCIATARPEYACSPTHLVLDCI